MMVVAWRWRSNDDGAMVWWHLFMEMTAVRGRWALIFLSPFTQFATNDWPMMDLKHVTELNFFLFTLPCHAYFLAFFMSFCSRMLSEDTPHFVIFGYCAFHHDIDGFLSPPPLNLQKVSEISKGVSTPETPLDPPLHLSSPNWLR